MRFIYSALLASSVLVACNETKVSSPEVPNETSYEKSLAAYPIKQHFKCLPESAAILAAHRGTSKQEGLSENSKDGLLALINHGVLIAEIDVAQSKDGVHFLYHDGVWEDDSTGRGAVAATNWSDAQKFLLNDTEGKLTSQTLSSLDDYLKIAQNKIYLEIDFKSSADYRDVIKAIRRYDMADKVILIAYSNKQAEQLARLAPNMMISMSVRGKNDLDNYKRGGIKTNNIAAWTGRDGPNSTLVSLLKQNNIPVLTYPSRDKARSLIKAVDLIVTDYALDQKPIIGSYDKADYLTCLNQ